MASLTSQSIASSYEQLLHLDRDGGGNGTTHVALKDGDNGTTFPITLATDAIMITSTNRLEFGDNASYIHQSADGVLDLVSDTEIELTATNIDINGIVDISGNATFGGAVNIASGLTTTGAVLNLQTNEPSVVANDVLGRINFQAPLEADGADGDARLVGASIHALVTASDFNDAKNTTDLVFSTAVSETATERMRITSDGASISGGSSNAAYNFKYQAASTSRSFRITSEHSAYADFAIQKETAKDGGSYENLLYFSATGTATFGGGVAIGSAIASYTDAITTSQTLSIGENQDSADKLASVQIIGRGSGSTDTVGALEFINTRSGSGVVSSIVGGRFNGGSASDGSLSFNTKNGSSLTTKMTINDVGNVGIGTSSPDYQLELEKAGGGFLSFKTTDTELQNNDVLGTIQFGADDATTSGIDIGAKIVATVTDNFQSAGSNVDAPTKLQFFTQNNSITDVMSTVGATLTLGGDDQNATFAGSITSNALLSNTSSTYDIGSSSNLWRDAYLKNGGRVYFGDTGTYVYGSSSLDVLSFAVGANERFKLDVNSRISLSNNDSGTSNTVFGKLAGDDLASGGNYNSLFGEGAGHAITTGDYNVGVGLNALDSSLLADRVTMIGTAAGRGVLTAAAIGSVGVGYAALNQNTEGEGNVAVGYEALATSINSDFSTAIGHQALKTQTGTAGTVGNTAVGYHSLTALTTGGSNTAVGYQSGLESTVEDYNTYIGYQSGYRTAGLDNQHNTFIGFGSGSGDWTSIKSDKNTGVGSLTLAGAMNSGIQNTALGFAALNIVTTGDSNVGVGVTAGNTLTTGSNNTVIGTDADTSASGSTNQIVIGQGATGVADNSVTLGNASVTTIAIPNQSMISSQVDISMADDATINIIASQAGAAMVYVYELAGGTGAAFFCTYLDAAVKVAGSSTTENADTDGKLCVFKSTSNHTVTVKNRLGATKRIAITVMSAQAVL